MQRLISTDGKVEGGSSEASVRIWHWHLGKKCHIKQSIVHGLRGDELLKVRVPGACVCSRRALANHIENWPKVNAIASFQVIHDGRRA
jgi:hypothetical protein